MQSLSRLFRRPVQGLAPTRAGRPASAPGRRGARTAAVAALAGLAALLLASVAPALASPGTFYASGVTNPMGQVWLPGNLGGHLWVADHVQGFCRLEPSSSGFQAINPTTCATVALSPGQPTYDPASRSIFVSDLSARGNGVWRLTFDPVSETVGNPVLLAPGAGINVNKPVATALGPDGKLYVSFLKNGNIVRITNPLGASQTVEAVGTSSDGRRVQSLAFVGSVLYLAQGAGVTGMPNATSLLCTGGCVAAPTGINAFTPTALASDGTRILYVADTSVVKRFFTDTHTQDTYSSFGSFNGSPISYQNISGLGVDSSGNLTIGDDPTAGASVLQGRVWRVPAGSAPDAATVNLVPPPPPPAPVPASTSGVLYGSGVTNPFGQLWMGGHLWVSDHVQGLCRLDLTTTGIYVINGAACQNFGGGSAGQAVLDPRSDPNGNHYVYVPDNSTKSQGVWRFVYNPNAETLSNPVLLAPAYGLGGNKPTGLALGPDGNLYLSFLKNGNIVRITNPAGAAQTAQVIGSTSDARRSFSLAFLGSDLYVAETGLVTRIANATSPACTGGCKAAAAGIGVISPMSLVSDGANLLYIGDVSSVSRYVRTTGSTTLLATAGTYNGTPVVFQNVSGLGLDTAGNLYVGDDPSGGAQIMTGRMWKVAPTP